MMFSRTLPWGLVSLLLVSCLSHSKTITHSTVEPFSLLRIGDRLNLMQTVTFDDGQIIQRWQFVDCKTNTFSALYWDRLNTEQHTTTRFYGNSYQRYAAAQPQGNVPAEEIKKLCSLPVKAADWEKIEASDDHTTLLDKNSLKHINNALIARVGYDYPEIIYEPPYDAPLGLKVENYVYNCETHMHAVLSAMNIASTGEVTDSLIGADIERRKESFPLTLLLRATFDKLCSAPDVTAFRALGEFTPRLNKPLSKVLVSMMPDMKNNSAEWLNSKPLSAEINALAQKLIKPWALPQFREISWDQKSNEATIKVRMTVDQQGYIRKLEDYGIWQVQRLSLANIIQLKYGMSISYNPAVLTSLDSTLTLPLFKGQRYSIRTVMPLTSDNKDTQSKFETCEVTGEGDAKNLSTAFSGRYWQIDCQEVNKGQPGLYTRSAWLKDLHLMVPVTQKLGDKAESAVTLENVTIVR